MSMEHLRFVLHEVLNIEQIFDFDRYKDFDKESADIMLDAVKSFADEVLFPSFRETDEQPARFEDGRIIVHPVVEKIMKHSGENGWIGSTFDYEVGGMQLPHVLYAATSHVAEAANNHLTGYTGLTAGSANLIVTFGSQELIDTYVPQMMSGEWGGTMCLTEPQAGSSLSDITTEAKPQDDGSYQVSGQKIFISGGDHDYCENFIHLVLARIEGAPAGTKGISLFVVPKLRPLQDGSLEPNDVKTVADFQKMGQKGYCTTHLVFGEESDCQGWLVGNPNEGLKHMFQMMNGARIDVGFTAASVATAAYYASLQYATERPQGRRILSGGKKNVDANQTMIINHPDVRRMLLLQKAVTEGAVSLLSCASLYHDFSIAGPEEHREKYHDLLELLTPICKTYPAEMGRESVSNAVQVLGGYGFCTEFLPEIYYRDIKIMALYEGTTGIQSLDLLGRKIVMNNGRAMRHLTKEIIDTIKAAENYDDLAKYASQLKSASKTLEEVIMHLLQYAMSGDHERYISDATVFMEFMGTIVIGWQWLKMATAAKTALVTGKMKYDSDFYESKIHTMRFYFKYELPKISGLKETLKHPESLTILNEEEVAMASVF